MSNNARRIKTDRSRGSILEAYAVQLFEQPGERPPTSRETILMMADEPNPNDCQCHVNKQGFITTQGRRRMQSPGAKILRALKTAD